jgi:hypothetical protein
MMPTDSIRVASIPPPSARERADALLWARMALLGELEASLLGSRKAVLALDLHGIEGGTTEQVGLIGELNALARRSVAPPATGRRSAEQEAPGLSACSPEVDEELRRSESRIREAVRLQAALLARARCKLRVLANMLAGPSVTYGPFLPNDARTRAVDWKCDGESDPCRA